MSVVATQVQTNRNRDPNIACHKNAVNANVSATVAAGGSVKFQWTEWPHNIGPVLTYVANCGGDCKDADKTALKFVKIDESGVDLSTQVWAAGKLMADGNAWTTTVPKSLAPGMHFVVLPSVIPQPLLTMIGHYVFRHEIIACHGCSSLNGAQNYPFCVNIDVTGSGTANPAGTVASSLYDKNDPGVFFNPYVTMTSYVIPGPALWTGN